MGDESTKVMWKLNKGNCLFSWERECRTVGTGKVQTKELAISPKYSFQFSVCTGYSPCGPLYIEEIKCRLGDCFA